MSNVPPTTPPAPPPGPNAPAPQPLGTVVAGGERLAGLPPGTILDAVVAAQGARGQATVKTALGDLTLRLAAALPDKAQIVLQLLATGGDGSPQVRVLAASGGHAAHRPGAPAGTPPQAAPAPDGTAATRPANPTPLTATVIRPAAASPVEAGAGLEVRLLSVQPPSRPAPSGPATPPGPAAGGTPPGTIGASPRTPVAASPPTAGTGPAPTAAGAPPATGGGATPAGALFPSATAGGASLPPTLSGTVAPNTQSGQPLVQTPLGLVALNTTAKLPAGSTVTLQVIGGGGTATPGTPTTAPMPAQALPPPSPAGWPAMQEAAQALRSDPFAAASMMRALPASGPAPSAPQIALGLIGFAAAMRLGDGRALVGHETAEALQTAGRADLAAKVLGDIGDMAGRLARPSGGEWRTVIVPFLADGMVEPVRLVTRRPPGSEEERAARDDEGERFVVDLTLSRLGRVQLDGLVRKRAKRFDLVVRTGQPLPLEARNDIAVLFREAIEGMGLAGQATFQATPRFFEPPTVEKRAGPGLMV